MAPVITNGDFDIVPTHLAVKAMRDSGYKNAAYALAELVDNSVQARATVVELLCKEDEALVNQRTRRRVQEIAVVDNGCGMSRDVLRKALQFGNGERLNDRSGIGRFGMGLPNSSISQAQKVDVWSWTKGYKKAIHSYLDLREIDKGQQRQVPDPKEAPIPEEWLKHSEVIKKATSGTLVVWSSLDKCDWRTANAIFRNSELTIGRIYRRFLSQQRLRIRMAAFMTGDLTAASEDVRPNDPLYLTTNTSCPDPWNSQPMFEQYGDPHTIQCKVGDRTAEVHIRFAVAKKAAREGYNPGSTAHGKHAENNIGVSVMRADRELELQTGWCIGYDPRERWWGVEVDFPPLLDEVFGVPNNKQGARTLAEFSTLALDQIAAREGFATEQELMDAWKEDNDPRLILVKLKNTIENNLSAIRKSIKVQHERARSRHNRSELDSAEMRATKATQTRQQEGYIGTSDKSETLKREERTEGIASTLIEDGVEHQEATQRAVRLLDDNRKYEFYEVDLATPEFFTVRTKAGALLIGLNTNHPAYEHLVALMKDESDINDIESLKRRLSQAYEGLKLLLEAWARYEDELTDGRRKEQAQMARLDWGRVARDFFREE